MSRVADLVPAPAAPLASVASAVRRRLAGGYTVDPWGLDEEVASWAAAAARVRWTVAVQGAHEVPAHGGVLLVANPRVATLAPLAAVLALGRAIGRSVRFTGVPDVEPVATGLRRIGGVIDRPQEVAGLLHDGHVVLVWCEPTLWGRRRVGPVRPELLAPALTAGAPVVPLGIAGSRWGRVLTVRAGSPLVATPDRRGGPLAAADAADRVRDDLEGLLDTSVDTSVDTSLVTSLDPSPGPPPDPSPDASLGPPAP
jgi:hypothetical protein